LHKYCVTIGNKASQLLEKTLSEINFKKFKIYFVNSIKYVI